jgi:epoxyqueuosine reductase QueG
MESLEQCLIKKVKEEVSALARPDLFREPLMAFSSADDSLYDELKQIIGEWHSHPKALLPDAKSVISYFVPFTKEVVRAPKKAAPASSLWGEAYLVLNEGFAHINEVICTFLQEQGFSAVTVPATHTFDPKDLKSLWSHRSAAAIANMGVFGANRMLITEKGSGGRFCTVITSAPLRITDKIPKNPCRYIKDGGCGLCFKVCPIGALQRDQFDGFGCQAQTKQNEEILAMEANLDGADVCGKCMSVCPVAYIK